MNNSDRTNPKKTTDFDARRAIRSVIDEASETDLREALSACGEDFDDVVERTRAVFSRALDEACGQSRSSAAEADDLDFHRGLGALLQLLRRRDRLTEEALAERAEVSTEEIRRIEFDPTFTPAPRTIIQLERFFKLPRKTLVLLSGAIRRKEPEVRKAVARFAAHSTSIGGLTAEEKQLLNEFVAFLGEHAKGD